MRATSKTHGWDRPIKMYLELSHLGRAKTSGGSWLFKTVKTLEETPSVCYMLDDQLRLIYCNPAWDRFAEANGAPNIAGECLIGTKLFASIPKVLTPLYKRAFQSASPSGRIWTQVYQCSSPTQFRKYRMRIYPVKRRHWFLVTNSLVIERAHRKVDEPDADAYFSRGIVMMCAHCRCVQRVESPERWDFVPEYLELQGPYPVNVSHGLCPICQSYFYPDL
jgi:hypothetical protein